MTQQSTYPAVQAAVLVVEDEPLLRMLAVDIVEDAGFVAIEAADADAAVRILEARSDVGLVFTDVDMPGSMKGDRLAACVRLRWPPIRLIVTSGHCLGTDLTLPSDCVFLPKPYAASNLIGVMERMLH